MNTKFTILLCFTFLLYLSCEKNKGVIGPEPLKYLSFANLKNLVSIELADYDSMIVRSKEEVNLFPGSITRIEMGEWDTGEFDMVGSTTPTFNYEAGRYRFSFVLPHNILNERLRAYYFTLRFFQENDNYVDLDTFALTYKFPYKTTEIFLATDQLHYSGYGSIYIQDFEFVGRKLYFYNLGPTTLWEYDLQTRELKALLYPWGGDHVAGDSVYLFLDIQHHYVYRYDIKKDTVDIQFNLPISTDNIRGIDVSDENVFVMLPGESDENSLLAVYDFQGNLIEEQQIPVVGYYLSVDNNILYTNDYENEQILRYDLLSNTKLLDKPLPAKLNDGMEVYDNKLYFADYYRQMISVMSLSELNSEVLVTFPKQNKKYYVGSGANKPPHEEEEF